MSSRKDVMTSNMICTTTPERWGVEGTHWGTADVKCHERTTKQVELYWCQVWQKSRCQSNDWKEETWKPRSPNPEVGPTDEQKIHVPEDEFDRLSRDIERYEREKVRLETEMSSIDSKLNKFIKIKLSETQDAKDTGKRMKDVARKRRMLDQMKA